MNDRQAGREAEREKERETDRGREGEWSLMGNNDGDFGEYAGG